MFRPQTSIKNIVIEFYEGHHWWPLLFQKINCLLRIWQRRASQSLETKSSSPIYFEIETLFWRKPEGTENTEVLELYVILNLRSEYSEQY